MTAKYLECFGWSSRVKDSESSLGPTADIGVSERCTFSKRMCVYRRKGNKTVKPLQLVPTYQYRLMQTREFAILEPRKQPFLVRTAAVLISLSSKIELESTGLLRFNS
jgi:hypothetical protein